MDDLTRAQGVLRALGEADVGQACVVQQGIVLAVEATGHGRHAGAGGRAGPAGAGRGAGQARQPGQDRRADLPAVGPGTRFAAPPPPGCAASRSRRAARCCPPPRPGLCRRGRYGRPVPAGRRARRIPRERSA